MEFRTNRDPKHVFSAAVVERDPLEDLPAAIGRLRKSMEHPRGGKLGEFLAAIAPHLRDLDALPEVPALDLPDDQQASGAAYAEARRKLQVTRHDYALAARTTAAAVLGLMDAARLEARALRPKILAERAAIEAELLRGLEGMGFERMRRPTKEGNGEHTPIFRDLMHLNTRWRANDIALSEVWTAEGWVSEVAGAATNACGLADQALRRVRERLG